MTLRVYFMYKAYFNYSFYNDAYSKKLCKDYGFNPSFGFILKTKFVKSPSYMLTILFALTVLVFSYATFVFEYFFMLWPETKSMLVPGRGLFFNVVYLVFMTLTTVGFGDYTAKTYPGKIVIILTSLWGAIMISLFVLITSNMFTLAQKEEKALSEIDMSRKATKTIIEAFRLFREKRHYHLL